MALITVTVMTVACSALRAWTSPSNDQPVVELARCGANPSSLCLVSFGLGDGNRMLINFFIPATSSLGYSLKVQYNEVTAVYACQTLKDSPTTMYCTSDPLPLGSSIHIEIYSKDGNALLASGSFVIDAMAIPTPLIAAPASGTAEIPSVATSAPPNTLVTTPIATTPSGPYPNP